VAALTQDDSLPDTGTIAGDLAAWAKAIAEDISRPARIVYLRAMASARPLMVDSCPCRDMRTRQAEQMIERGRGRGERTPTSGQVLDHLIGPLYYYAVFGMPLDADRAAALVADVLTMREPART
jgi:hypothetical protein